MRAGIITGNRGSTTPARASSRAAARSAIVRLSPRTLLSSTSVRAPARAAIQAAIESEVIRKLLSSRGCRSTIAEASRIGTMPRAATRRATLKRSTATAPGQRAARATPY